MASADVVAFALDEAVQVLGRTPGALRALLQDLSDAWLSYQEDAEAWSPLTVLIHFIHNERMNWIPRARIILSGEDRREFPPFRQLPEDMSLSARSTADLLAQFAQLREHSLAELKGFDLREEDFDRDAIHPVLGSVTLRQLISTWVVHDLNHTHQIAKTLAKRYREAVGPWRQFLSILDA
jgi:hypothetical protein